MNKDFTEKLQRKKVEMSLIIKENLSLKQQITNLEAVLEDRQNKYKSDISKLTSKLKKRKEKLKLKEH